MSGWSLEALARAASAEMLGPPAAALRVQAIGTDSRALVSESLFVALRGERFDGHQFIDSVAAQGATAVMVDRRSQIRDVDVPVLLVDDTLRAFGDMAAWHRLQREREVVAITGSNGKTTAKELIAACLGLRGPVHKTAGNLNNLIGVPRTLFDWPDEAECAVVEMGMNAPGEIARLAEIAQPNVALITNVAPAHLEGVGSIQAVADAKGELFEALGPHATAVVNVDDPWIRDVCRSKLSGQRQITFGTVDDADVRCLSSQVTVDGTSLILRYERTEIEVVLPIFGAHNALNATAAAAVALAFECTASEVVRGLALMPSTPRRLNRIETPQGIHVLDDTYNANPASMAAAFETLASLAGSAARVAILGDMRELGLEAASWHDTTGYEAGRSGIGRVLAVGQYAEAVAAGARRGGAQGAAFADMEALLSALDTSVVSGDWVIVKGSRGMRMERVVERLASEKR